MRCIAMVDCDRDNAIIRALSSRHCCFKGGGARDNCTLYCINNNVISPSGVSLWHFVAKLIVLCGMNTVSFALYFGYFILNVFIRSQ